MNCLIWWNLWAENASFDNSSPIMLSSGTPWFSAWLFPFLWHYVPLHSFHSSHTCTIPCLVLYTLWDSEKFFFFLYNASSKVPLGERHVMLTAHVFNDRRVLKSNSAHLSSLRRCKGSTSLTRLPCGIDHLMILKYSQHPHNNKKTHRGVVCSILITLQRLYGVSQALRVSKGKDLK